MKSFNKVVASSVIAGLFLSAMPTAGIQTADAKANNSHANYHAQMNHATGQKPVTCKGNVKAPKNIIFMIGDGMGPSYNTAHRYMLDNPATAQMELTSFDHYLLGTQRTIAEDEHENITDSASAATAMSAGVKTYNNAIAVDNDKTEVKTVLERAKEVGKSTGLVATSEVTHATPAAYGAHDESRKNMAAIADDYYNETINGKHKVDVILGGGRDYFERKDKDLVSAFKKDGYQFATNKQEMQAAEGQQLLGLFSKGGMPKMIDRAASMPSLQDMTQTALDKLSTNKKGFFLMVEGSQIDWAGHANDITGAMSEMQDFDLAFQTAIDYAKKDCNTLVIATADHSTGGFSIGANGVYNWFVEPIKQMKHTPEYLRAQLMKDGADVEQIIKANVGFELKAEEMQAIKDAVAAKDAIKIENAIEAPVNTRSLTGWTTGGHTGEDVNVYGYGPASSLWRGNIENTENAKHIFNLIK